jgi:hypothetical protein
MVGGPISLCRQFLEVCLFVAAFATTAKLVERILEKGKPDPVRALKEVAPDWKGILLFSFKYIVVFGAISGILVLSASIPVISHRFTEIAASKAFDCSVGLLGAGVAAWLLMPAAIRLLQRPEVAPISVECRRLGTIFVVLASAAGLALENLLNRAEAGMVFDNQSEPTALAVLNTIVVNAPEVLLFIALALLARQAIEGGVRLPSADEPSIPPDLAAE